MLILWQVLGDDKYEIKMSELGRNSPESVAPPSAKRLQLQSQFFGG